MPLDPSRPHQRFGLRLALLGAVGLAGCPAGTPSVGAQSATTTAAIINGETCDASVYPTAVGIILDATINFGGSAQTVTMLLCTGTLIAPDVVIAAAHCLDASQLGLGIGQVTREDYYVDFEPNISQLAAGAGSLPIPQAAIPARDHIAHPDFHLEDLDGSVAGPGDYHDIGLLFLAEPVTDVLPEVVVTAEEASILKAGQRVAIAGWGQSVEGQPGPQQVGIKHCGQTRIGEVGKAEMQIGTDQASVRKCHGDSGGPTYANIGAYWSRSQRVIGVTSHAYDAEDCNKGGVDTRIDVHLDWLDEQMRSRCDNGTRAWCDVPGIIPPAYYDSGPGKPEGCASAPPAEGLVGGLVLLLARLRRRRARYPIATTAMTRARGDAETGTSRLT